ncbi:hypothetical protein [Erwinia sp. CGal63]|uniref:hypothetical protein n=1 Tax=Erwinia sp. CGal63 TaxID=2919889 RepID=UPI0030091508
MYNNSIHLSGRSGGVSRRRVILPFPKVVLLKERDLQLLEKITAGLAVNVPSFMEAEAISTP